MKACVSVDLRACEDMGAGHTGPRIGRECASPCPLSSGWDQGEIRSYRRVEGSRDKHTTHSPFWLSKEHCFSAGEQKTRALYCAVPESKQGSQLGMLAHILSIWKAEAGGLVVQGHPLGT